MTIFLLQKYLAVGAILFVIGLIGFMARRNLIVLFLSTELMFQGIAVNFIAFGRYHMGPLSFCSSVANQRSMPKPGEN
jgi:NADH-quinone oxidoreductase subunit K